MQTRRTGLERYLVARRDPTILPRAQCHRKGVFGQIIRPLQEVLRSQSEENQPAECRRYPDFDSGFP